MSLRLCVYKNCGYQASRTVFRFPKDPEAREKWIVLGQAPRDLNPYQYFYCSNHFDKRFLSITQRRMSLVGKAMPNPYREQEVEQYKNSNATINIVDDNDDDDLVLYDTNNDLMCNLDGNNMTLPFQGEQEFNIESTTKNADEFNLFNFENIADDDIIIDRRNIEQLIQQPAQTENNYKRSFSETTPSSSSSGPSKSIKILNSITLSSAESTATKNHSNIKQSVQTESKAQLDEMDHDMPTLIDSENVTTFIFKSEEYVQMPKEYYVEEKLKLFKKLRKMQNIINSIKTELNKLD